jgi:hypothetical protein
MYYFLSSSTTPSTTAGVTANEFLQQAFSSKLGIPVYIWQSYTLETTLLTDLTKLAGILNSYFAAQHITLDSMQLEIALQQQIQVLAQTKLDEFENNQGEILKWLQARRQNQTTAGLSNNILPKDQAYADIKDYHQAKLKNQDVTSLATKQDVQHIIDQALKQLDITQTPSLLDIINHINLATFYDEWYQMAEKLEL